MAGAICSHYPRPCGIGHAEQCHGATQAIASFGREKGFSLVHALGFTRGKTPAKATFSVIFRLVAASIFEQLLAQWIVSRGLDQEKHFSFDGGTSR
jgi:hypothetical protein